MDTKSTLILYRSYKKEIAEEKWFRIGVKYSVMLRTRGNALKIGERDWGNDTNVCNLCHGDAESLLHFLFHCSSLQETRSHFIHLQLPSNYNQNDLLKNILLFNEGSYFSKEYFIDMVYL